MNINKEFVGIVSLCAAASGFGLSMLIISSENGYVGSIIFLPLFLLVIVVGIVLFIVSIIIGFGSDQKSWGWTLLSLSFFLPTSFVASYLIAKYFEIGAYRQEPMIPFPIL
jgi:hypothetical protein